MELSHSSSSSSFNHRNSQPTPPSPSTKPITRTEPASPYPTTFVQADTSSFKQVVQMLTGSPETNSKHTSKPHNIPPIKSSPKKQQSFNTGFRLYERRNSMKNNLKINPLNSKPNSGFSSSPRSNKHELLSPSVLDFPALVISPVTPLLQDPFGFGRSCSSPMSSASHLDLDKDAEEKAIMEKCFFLHPSPANTPRDGESPRLLPLFPTTSPRGVGDCSSSCPDS